MTDSAAFAGDNNEANKELETIPPQAELPPNQGKINSLIDYFHAAIFEPISTIKRLSAANASQTEQLWFEAFFVVIIAGAIMGGVKSQSPLQLLYNCSSRILDLLITWYIVTSILHTLSKEFGVRKYSIKEGAAITGIAFAPLVLTGLLGCLAALPASAYFFFLSLPVFWSISLMVTAFRVSLGLSYLRLMLLVMIIPPLLFLVETFWLGLALLMALGLPFRT